MFDQINGLPVHALVLHAAVIFVPLLAFGAVVYAVRTAWRPKIGWAVALLAIAAPVTTLVTMLSGKKLYDRLLANGINGPIKETLEDHMSFGVLTFWFSLALGVVSLVIVWLTLRKPGAVSKPAEWGAAAVMVVLAALSLYFVFRTGDSGAHAVWGQSG